MEDPRYSVSEDGTLRIAPMSDTDLGVYECMAKSPTGEVKSRSAKMIYNKQNCESLISYLLCSQEKSKFYCIISLDITFIIFTGSLQGNKRGIYFFFGNYK